MNIQKAIDFIRKNGNIVEQARLNYILTNEHPSEEVLADLFAGQQSDGGWAPFWAADYSSLDATCFRLAQAAQLDINESELAVARAVNFLAQRQSAEGSWEEDITVADAAPPWAKPGDLSAKLYLTANCGLWLSLRGNPNDQASKAAEYLQTYLEQDGHLPSFLHTHWLAGGLWWHKLNWEASTHVFEYLRKRLNDLAVSNLSWLITTLGSTGVPASNYLVEEAANLLEQNQHEDGYWESEDGPGSNVHTTVEAFRALWLCGRT